MDSPGSAYEVSDRNKDSIRSQNRGYSCDSLAKNLVSFCQYPQNLGVKFKDKGLICLADEISRQDGTQAGAEEAAVIDREISTIAGEHPVKCYSRVSTQKLVQLWPKKTWGTPQAGSRI